MLAAAALLAALRLNAAGSVEELTTAEFLGLASADLSLVEFYAPWCELCMELQPAFETVGAQLSKMDPSIRFGRIDAEKHEAVGKRYNVTAYPDLRVFRKMTDYKVPGAATRHMQGELLLEYMQYQVDGSPTPVEVKDPKQLEHLSRRTFEGGAPANSVVLLGVFPPAARPKPTDTTGDGDKQERAAQLAMGRGASWKADMARGEAELAMFHDLAWELRGTQLGYTLAYSCSEEMQAIYGGSTESNGTLVVFLADPLRLGPKEAPPAAAAASAVPIAGQLPFHDRGHARLDLGALLSSRTSRVSTEARDQTTRGDGKEMHETEIASRLAIYHSHVAKASRVAMHDASNWVLSASRGRMPLVGELTPANTPFSAHPYFALPIMILFYDQQTAKSMDLQKATPAEKAGLSMSGPRAPALWRRELRKVAQATRTSAPGMTFVLASAVRWATSLSDLGISADDFSQAAAVIVDKHQDKFPFVDSEVELDTEGLKSCVKQWAKGKAKPHMRSAPAPDPKKLAAAAVKTVVGSNFAAMVTDDNGGASPDVLLQLFSPHDQICRVLAPHYQMLAQRVVDHPTNSRVRSLRVAAIDVSRNDVPVAYRGSVPTVWLVRKGKQRLKPLRLELSGNATEIGDIMLAFLEKNLPDTGPNAHKAGAARPVVKQAKKDEL